MPKVLIVGEKAFAVHSFSEDELNKTEISETRNDSVAKIGSVFDQDLTEESMNSIKNSIIMFLKQSDTYKLKPKKEGNFDGYVLTVFKGKALNGRKNYIANWIAKVPVELVTQKPEALIPELLKGFKGYLTMADYHKKSLIHQLVQ